MEIYRQENLENPELLEGLENLEDAFVEKVKEDTLGMFYFQYIRAFDEIIVEYLRLSFEFPESSQEELLALFRTIYERSKSSYNISIGIIHMTRKMSTIEARERALQERPFTRRDFLSTSLKSRRSHLHNRTLTQTKD